jgi:hypothetical protein
MAFLIWLALEMEVELCGGENKERRRSVKQSDPGILVLICSLGVEVPKC